VSKIAATRRSISNIDPGYLVVLAICLLAMWPFVANASLPQDTDAELHIFRLAELSYLVRGGEFYPRWAPNFYHGYGYPIFNYYAPLSYYVALLFELLPMFSAVTAVKITFLLSMVLGAVGMYGFVRDNWSRSAGYVAAAVYLYAPYIQYIDPHARGVLPEFLGLAIFPLALWAFDRLRRRASVGRWMTAVFLAAAIILSHNLMAMLFFAALLGWIIWQWGLQQWVTNSLWPGMRYLLPALLLGVGVAAFFWLPVALERNEVNLNTLLGQGDNYDFHTHFLSLQELLRLSAQLDWGNTEPVFYFNLGVAQWVLGGFGVLMLLLRRVRHAAHAAFFAIAALVLIFMMTSASAFVWETIPMLPYFQFPWRLLGGASIALAVLAGVGVDGLLGLLRARLSPLWLGGITAVFVAIPLLFALPLTQPTPWPDFGDVFALRVSLIEMKGRWLGTTSTADYVPVTVKIIPRRNQAVVQGFYDGAPLDRVNRVTLPAGAVVETTELSPLHFQYNVSSPEDFALRLFLFQFPGWQVRVDGELVETEVGRPEGFIVVPLTAGDHLVDVRFGSTPARTAAWIITVLSLITAVSVAILIKRKPQPVTGLAAHARWTVADTMVLGGVLLITAVTILLLIPSGQLHMNSTGFVAEPADVDLFANFGDQIALLGYDVSDTAVNPGEQVELSLYWKAQRPLDINYQSFVHLLNEDGALVAQSDHLNPGDFPTRRWPLDKYVRDPHLLVLPPNLPPGAYAIKVGLWVQNEGWRLPLFDETGTQIDDGQVLMHLQVAPD